MVFFSQNNFFLGKKSNKNSTRKNISLAEKDSAPSSSKQSSLRAYQNKMFVPDSIKEKPIFNTKRSSTLGYGVGVVPIYYRNNLNFSSPDVSYDIPFDLNGVRQMIKEEDDVSSYESVKRLCKNYKMTNPSELDHHLRSESEVSEPNEHHLPEIACVEKEEIPENKKIIEANLEVDEDKVSNIQQENMPTSSDKPRHLDAFDGKPRKLGSRKFGSRKIIGSIKSIGSIRKKSIKAYGERLVLNRRLFGFASVKLKNENADEDSTPKNTEPVEDYTNHVSLTDAQQSHKVSVSFTESSSSSNSTNDSYVGVAPYSGFEEAEKQNTNLAGPPIVKLSLLDAFDSDFFMFQDVSDLQISDDVFQEEPKLFYMSKEELSNGYNNYNNLHL